MTVHYFKSLKVTMHTFFWTQKMPLANKVYRTCLILLYRNTGTGTVVCYYNYWLLCFNSSHFFFFVFRQPQVGLGLLIIEASQSHSDTPHSLGLLWTSDQTFRRDLYLTKHNTHKRQTSTTPAGFKPAILTSERPQTCTLEGAATGIGYSAYRTLKCEGWKRN